jgi:hypothetical protein
MKKSLIAASVVLGVTAAVSQAGADELNSTMPSYPITSGIPSSAFMGDYLFSTNNGGVDSSGCYFHVDMEEDGNLVTYAGDGRSSAWWSSNTHTAGANCGAGVGCYYATLQTDGNFVIYNGGNGSAVWNTHTNGNPGDHLIQQEDGNLVVYNASSSAIWNAGHYGSNQTGPNCFGDDSFSLFSGYTNTSSQAAVVDLTGSPFGMSAASCGNVCAQTGGCVAFNYNAADFHCGLITSTSGSLTSRSNFYTGFVKEVFQSGSL